MTLADRLNEGKIPVAEALRYGLNLAEALRKIHDHGRVHGALMPSNIVLSGAVVELAHAESAQGISAYTAPEVVQGKAADSRSDIFGFGAILFEMLTGKRAFEGEGDGLAQALLHSAPPASGSPLVDRVVASCVAKNPEARWQRMQKVIMELKLLAVAARRGETAAPSRQKVEQDLRAEMQRMEARVTGRMEAHERSIAQMQQTASEAVSALRTQLATVGSQLASAQEQMLKPAAEMQSLGEKIIARVEATIDAVGKRVDGVEQGLGELRTHSANLHENVAADLLEFERTLKAQQASIESARTAMGQTDDLVERVVEALEFLQSTVLDEREERASVN